MIVGVGVDVVPVERFAAALARTPLLAERLFTPAERSLPVASLAVRFAAKEAVAKALGAPAGLHWHDAEIVRGPGGRPALRVTGTVAMAAAGAGVGRWHLSLSHDGGMAVAMVVAETDPAAPVAPRPPQRPELVAEPRQEPSLGSGGEPRREQGGESR